MAGELLAMRRAAVGAPIADYARIVDRARVNKGGKGTSASTIANTSGASSIGTAVISGGTTNTKTADWVELIASTAFNAEIIVLTITNATFQTATLTGTLIDIAFGGAGSEVVKIPDFAIGHRQAGASYIIPFAVPAGTRISAKTQSTVVSKSVTVNIQLRQAGDHSAAPTVATSYGTQPGTNSYGQSATTAGGANAKSAWKQLTASTTGDITRLVVGIQGDDSNMTASTGLLDIGVGAAASEVVIVPDIYYVGEATEVVTVEGAELAYTVNVPAGSRLAFRYQATSAAAGARPNCMVLGLGN